MTLSLFVLAKKAPVFLPSAHSMALKPSFPFRLVRCVQAFVLKPASFCKLSADPGSPNKSDIALFISFSLTLFLYVLASLSSPPHVFYFTLFGIFGRNYSFFPFLSSYNGSPVIHFFREMTQRMS